MQFDFYVTRDVDVACMHAMMYAHQQADLVGM